MCAARIYLELAARLLVDLTLTVCPLLGKFGLRQLPGPPGPTPSMAGFTRSDFDYICCSIRRPTHHKVLSSSPSSGTEHKHSSQSTEPEPLSCSLTVGFIISRSSLRAHISQKRESEHQWCSPLLPTWLSEEMLWYSEMAISSSRTWAALRHKAQLVKERRWKYRPLCYSAVCSRLEKKQSHSLRDCHWWTLKQPFSRNHKKTSKPKGQVLNSEVSLTPHSVLRKPRGDN